MAVNPETGSAPLPARMRVRVSVVIPVYNAGSLLNVMMDSVLAQTEQSIEVVAIDDGSCDGGKTAAILREYAEKDGRVRVISQENKGVSRARDFGVEQAKGEWVYVCDQDDYLHPQMLEFCLWACEKYNLDYLKITHEFGSVKATSRLSPIKDFAEIPIDVVDNSDSDGDTVGMALKKLHTDAWSQFVKRDLALMFPALEYDVSRAFHIVNAASRWGVEDVPLYYYHGDIMESLIHKAVAPDWIDILHDGWRRVYDLYANRATDERGRTILRYVCKYHIAAQLKVIFHMVKRMNRLNGFKTQCAVWRNFGAMTWDFLFVRKIAVGMVGVKHYIEYLALALAFRLLPGCASGRRAEKKGDLP